MLSIVISDSFPAASFTITWMLWASSFWSRGMSIFSGTFHRIPLSDYHWHKLSHSVTASCLLQELLRFFHPGHKPYHLQCLRLRCLVLLYQPQNWLTLFLWHIIGRCMLCRILRRCNDTISTFLFQCRSIDCVGNFVPLIMFLLNRCIFIFKAIGSLSLTTLNCNLIIDLD